MLVNNAVLTYFTQLVDYPLHRWLRAFQVNVHAPFLLSQAVLPSMIERGGGAIVNIFSGSAIGPGRGPTPARRRRAASSTDRRRPRSSASRRAWRRR